MIYVPILIPTLCRAEHFIRCVESLKNNSWAKYTDVFIGLDYPPTEKYLDGYYIIKEYLSGDFSCFNSFQVIEHSQNVGSAGNMLSLRKSVEKYPYFIRTDDDAEFSPNFLEYMNKVLWHYLNDSTVLGVTGYCYPINWNVKEGSNTFRMNFLCPMWGTAFYTDRFNSVRNTLCDSYYEKNFDRLLFNKAYKKLTIARYLNFVNDGGLNEDPNSLVKRTTDIGIGTFMPLDNNYCIISPITSKVRNHGFDGTGEYCQNVSTINKREITAQNYDYSHQPIDSTYSFDLFPDDSTEYEINRKILDCFDTRPYSSILKTEFKLSLYKVLGRERYFSLKHLIKGMKNEQ